MKVRAVCDSQVELVGHERGFTLVRGALRRLVERALGDYAKVVRAGEGLEARLLVQDELGLADRAP